MIFNLGSINADYLYALPHLPQPGETLAATGLSTGLGGKGANMSVAIARAGGQVQHIGAVGPDGAWAVEQLAGFGVQVRHIANVEAPTGHAIINVDPQGENAIVIFAGANCAQTEACIEEALREAQAGDLLVLQNETNGKVLAATRAKEKEMRVVYAAAPFDPVAAEEMLNLADILILNEIEFRQLREANGREPGALGVETIVVTRGARGARLFERSSGWTPVDIAAPKVEAVDTTGAGDTLAGYFAAGIDAGMSTKDALARAVSAAALKVTRMGTAEAIPTLAEVEDFMG